jgi:hypothetical protein
MAEFLVEGLTDWSLAGDVGSQKQGLATVHFLLSKARVSLNLLLRGVPAPCFVPH